MFDKAPEVLILTPPKRDAQAVSRGLSLFGRIRTCAYAGTLDAAGDPQLVLLNALALADEAEARAVRASLDGFLRRKVPVLALVEHMTARRAMLAVSAGASLALPAEAPVQAITLEVRQLVDRRLRADVARKSLSPTAGAAQEVGFRMADLLGLAASGAPIEPEAVGPLGSLLLDAVGQAGIRDWIETVTLMHQPTIRHCMLMAGIMAAFVGTHRFAPADAARLVRAAVLHDVGKVLIPPEILDKPRALDEAEQAQMRLHPALGYELLRAQAGHDPLTLSVARSHHEYLDGSGYPDGLRGGAIADPVRLATICDVFTALIEPRAYKPVLPLPEAYAAMEAMGPRLDQELLAGFRRLFQP